MDLFPLEIICLLLWVVTGTQQRGYRGSGHTQVLVTEGVQCPHCHMGKAWHWWGGGGLFYRFCNGAQELKSCLWHWSMGVRSLGLFTDQQNEWGWAKTMISYRISYMGGGLLLQSDALQSTRVSSVYCKVKWLISWDTYKIFHYLFSVWESMGSKEILRKGLLGFFSTFFV